MSTIVTLFTDTFYDVAAQLTVILVPLIAMYVIFDLLRGILWGRD